MKFLIVFAVMFSIPNLFANHEDHRKVISCDNLPALLKEKVVDDSKLEIVKKTPNGDINVTLNFPTSSRQCVEMTDADDPTDKYYIIEAEPELIDITYRINGQVTQKSTMECLSLQPDWRNKSCWGIYGGMQGCDSDSIGENFSDEAYQPTCK